MIILDIIKQLIVTITTDLLYTDRIRGRMLFVKLDPNNSDVT